MAYGNGHGSINGDPEEHSRLLREIHAKRREETGVWTTKPICGAPTRGKENPNRGKPCQRPAGWGTKHPGMGTCKLHGGCSPIWDKKAAIWEAQQEVMRLMGPAIEVDPMDALIWCVRIAAGEVAYATMKIEELDPEQAVLYEESKTERNATGGKNAESYEETSTSNVGQLNLWIRTRQTCLDRLAKFSKMALDAGVEERRVRMAESAGDELAVAIRNILEGLNLTAEQEMKAPEIVRRSLEAMERGQLTA